MNSGADGVRSTLRPNVLQNSGHNIRAPETGMVAFRFILTASEVEEAAGKLRVMDPKQPPCFDQFLALDGSKREIIMYPCRHFQLLNVLCIAPKLLVSGWASEPWLTPVENDRLMEAFSDFGGPLQAFFR